MGKSMKVKVLISSILTITLCLVAMVGSTLAFIAEEAPQSYAITSGNIDVDATIGDMKLYSATADRNGNITDENGEKYSYALQQNGTFANGGTARIDDSTLTIQRMASGDKAEATITVSNNSDVDIVYRAVTRIEVDNGLMDGLIFNIGGRGVYGAVNLYSAWTPLAPGAQNITLPVSIELPITAGNEFQNKTAQVSFTVEAVIKTANTGFPFEATSGEHTVNDVILINGNEYPSAITAGGTAHVTVVDGYYDGGNGDGQTAVTAKGNANVEIKDGYFTVGTNDAGEAGTVVYAKEDSTVTITGGFFEGLGGTASILDTEDGSNAEIVVKGGTFVNFDPSEFVPDGYEVESEVRPNGDVWYNVVAHASTFDELKQAFADGTDVVLTEDIVLTETLVVEKGDSVTLELNGKTLSIADGSNIDPLFNVKTGGELIINGDGNVDLGSNYAASLMLPFGDVTINGGTYTRDYNPDISVYEYGSMFMGINRGVGKLIINDGYFDSGCYAEGDCYNNCYCLVNLSNDQYVRIYGGVFVAQNPAWGDEGYGHVCCPDSTFCQGTFLEGQVWTDTEIPAAYTIVEGALADGRPTYTVNYNP